MFLYDGATLTPFRTELDAVLTASQLYRGTPLADGTFALTTTANGLVIIDRQGRAVMHVNRANGLPSDVVYYAMPDKEGAVWVALDSGLARLEVPSPASFLDPQEGLPSPPFDMVRVNGRLYAAVQTGVFYLAPAGAGGEAPTVPSNWRQPLAVLELRQSAADRRRRPGGADHRVQRGALRNPRDDGARRSTPRWTGRSARPSRCRRKWIPLGSGWACSTASPRSGDAAGSG